tara:strand:- start:13 stop:630 length:618 start_codon:yes stop_codon:yes gene_type:complete
MIFLNFFNSKNDLDNKIIYLVANNGSMNMKRTNETFLCEDSVVIRFNNDPIQLKKRTFNKRCDYMFCRCDSHGKYKKLKITDGKYPSKLIFTIYKKGEASCTKNENIPEILSENEKREINNYKMTCNYISFLDNSEVNSSPTTGFGVLMNILKYVNYKKVVLVGYSNLSRNDMKETERYGCHNSYKENMYFKENRHKWRDIEIWD